MKPRITISRSRNRGVIGVVVLIGVSLALAAQGPPTKSIAFTTGKFGSKLGASACTADLDNPGSSLDFYQSKMQAFGASYTGKQCNARFSLLNLHGPGKYGKANIFNLSVQWDVTKAWNFNKAQDDCTFTFTRLDEGGADGGITCTGKAPFTEAKFSAAP